MATRKENAEAIKAALGTEINTDRSDPKADLLTRWAELAKTDADGARREILSWQVENALGVQLPSENVTVEQLQGWLDRTATDPEAVKTEIQDGPTPAPTPAPTPEGSQTLTSAQAVAATVATLRVTVSAKVAVYGGTYTDPDQPDAASRNIGSTPVTVQRTPLIRQGLREGSLTEVK